MTTIFPDPEDDKVRSSRVSSGGQPGKDDKHQERTSPIPIAAENLPTRGELRVRMRSMLGERWDDLSRAFGDGNPAVRDKVISAISDAVDPEHFDQIHRKAAAPAASAFTREEPNPGERPLDRDGGTFAAAMAESAEDASVVLRDELRNSDPRRVAALFMSKLPSILEEAERRRGWTAENRVDLVLHFFIVRAPEAATPALKHLMALLRGHMDQQREDARGDGYYQSVAAIGDVVAMAGRKYFVESVFYYHEVLSHYWRQCREGRALSEQGRLRVRNCLFNILTGAMDVLQRSEQSVDVTGLQTMAQAGVVMHADLAEVKAGLRDDYLSRFVRGMGTERFEGVQMSTIQGMARAHGAWPQHLEGERAVLQTAAACTALVRDVDQALVPTMLFNAAVDLLRNSRTAASERLRGPAGALARALLTGGGLLAASESSDGSIEDAIGTRHGLQCAVNLFGAATELGWNEGSRKLLHQLGEVVLSARGRIREPRDADFSRIASSLRSLGMQQATMTSNPTVGELKDRTRAVLRELAGSGQPPQPIDMSDWRLTVADAARIGLIHGLGEEGFRAAWGHIWNLAARISEESQHPAAAFAAAYERFAARRWGEAGSGPLAGIQGLDVTAEQWARMPSEAIKPAPSLASAIRLLDTPDWWVR